MPPGNRKPLVLGPRNVDAEVTPPPEGYVPPEQAGAPAGEQAPPPANRTPPGGDTPPPTDSSARNAQNDSDFGDSDFGDSDPGDSDPGEEEIVSAYTYASENQVQAARLVLRAYARQRDGVPPKAVAARAAIAELRAMGGNRAQVQMVLADARVRPREIGLKADGTEQ